MRQHRAHAIGPTLTLVAAIAGLTGCDAFPTNPMSQFPRRTAWTPFSVSTNAGVRPRAITTADFNADGRVDIVVSYDGNAIQLPEVVLFLQVFNGTTITWTPITIGLSDSLAMAQKLHVTDLNGDGRLDVMVAADGRILYLRSPADLTDSGAWTTLPIADSDDGGIGQWNDVLVAQIDNLAGRDIIACNSETGLVSFFIAPLVFMEHLGWTRFDIDATTREGAQAIVVLDLNADGRLDVVSTAADEASARVAWYRNPGGDSTGAWSKFTIGNIGEATRLAMADLDRDGRQDAIVSNPGALSADGANDGIQIGWYRQPTDPTAAWSGFVLAQYNDNVPQDLGVVDVDVNGNPDVIAGTSSAGSLRWFTRRDNIEQDWIENNLADLTTNIQAIAIADIDNDARPDVVAALRGSSETADNVSWYLNPE